MKIGIASDHAGFELKETVKKYLEGKGHSISDFGCNTSESVDYPDYAHPLAEAVGDNTVEKGIAICGSGNGINMTVNKHQEIRSALCWTAEIAKMAREHNNANVLAIPARYIPEETALTIIDTFFNTHFEGGRHERRIDKIPLK
jgi:ribose 5-phosphate isomerase B